MIIQYLNKSISQKETFRILIEIFVFFLLVFLLLFVFPIIKIYGADIPVNNNLNTNFLAVDSHINSFIQNMNVNGASIIVKDYKGNIIYKKNYGSDFDENTVVTIASATKWLTGATIMTLVEEGLIQSLDDPVSKYLSYFKNKGEKSNITIRQMLAFTSGLPEHHSIQDYPNITQQQECAYIAQNVALLRSPGTGFEYGGLQEELAACVAEVVTGKPFRTIMQERLLDPLEMNDTKLANLVNRNPNNPDFLSANPLTSGGIYTNSSSLIKFSQMILAGGVYNGKRIISEETVKAMKADQTYGVPIYRTIWTGDAEIQWRYGLGNWVQVLNPKNNYLEDEEKRLISSEGAFGTSEWVDFDLQYAAAFTIWAKVGEETTAFVNALKNLVSEAVETELSDNSKSLPVCRELIPSDTDSAISLWNEPHIVCSPGKGNMSGELFVFLPGTGATPQDYNYLIKAAAEAGMHVIGLRYPNDRSANIQICPYDPDDDCHEKVRLEITQGKDVSENVSVDYHNSVEGRLLSALITLDKQNDSNASWGSFIKDGGIKWDSVVISGHSQGGGHAAFIGYQHRVNHVIEFAWADVRKGEIAKWLIETTSQTPSESYYLFWHEQDSNVAKYQAMLMNALGIDTYGAPVVVDGKNPPYNNSHGLIATYPAPEGELPHNTHVVDKALVFDEKSEPIYKKVWQYLITLGVQTKQESKIADAIKIGDSSLGYIDPEFYSELNLVVFADSRMDAWLSSLDPKTGDFISTEGRDIHIDSGLTPLRLSFNAPEFGVDKNGWSLYYTKDLNGIPQIFRATINGENVDTESLTSDNIERLSFQASKNAFMENTRLLYALGGFSADIGKIAWFEEDNPQLSETIVDKIDRGARWIDGTKSFAFIHNGQAAIYDTETKTTKIVSTTPGEKSYPYAWLEPDTNKILLLTIVDDKYLEIYSDNGSANWDLISTLNIPSESEYGVIGSPEAFTAGGKSYITLVIKEKTIYAPSEVWVWGIDNGENRFTLRCEDRQGKIIRTDPEVFIGENQIFVFYNAINSDQIFDLYRCDTGLTP